METKNKNKYTNSIFYKTFLTGKYIKKMGEQLFSKLNFDFTTEEFSALDFIYMEDGICQRDLAIKMLIDRANMGKILNSLEKKGFVLRKLSLKNNRPVKVVSLTEFGEETYLKVVQELRNMGEGAISEFSDEEVEIMANGLEKIRNILKTILKIDI